jgi:hypothetical protein
MVLVLLLCAASATRADVDTRGTLREVSPALSAPGEVKPLVSTENEDYECTAKYSTTESGAFSWAIGNCPKGLTLEAVVRRLHSDSEPEGDYALGGWVGGAFQGCGWIEYDMFKPKAIKSKPTTACAEIAGGKYEVAESNFIAKHNSGAGDGYFVVNKVACPEYANYRPWTSGNLEEEKIRTVPAYAAQEPGSNVPELKWRYISKYGSTDGTGQYVMVRDAAVTLKEEKEKVYGQGNWVFVPRSCLPSTLPENEEESRIPPKPSVTTESASGVQTPSATLNGSINPEGVSTTYYFQYGTTTNWNESSTSPVEIGSGTGTLKEGASVTGLAGGTTYYYRVVATSAVGTSVGNAQSFTTQPPPTVVTGEASSISQEQAVLNGTVNPNGLDTHYYFQYGRTTEYGSSTPSTDVGSGTSVVPVNASIAGLQPGLTYHFRIVASNAAGPPSYGEDYTFAAERTSTTATLLTSTGEQYTYYRGTNNRLYFWYWNDTTWKLEWLGETGVVAGNPSPVQRENGEKYVYYRGTNGQLYYWYWNDHTWKLEWLGETGALAGDPKAVVRSNGEQYVYYRGTNGRLYYWYWNDHTWKLEWLGEPSALAGNPSPVVRSNGEQYVYYRGTNGRLYYWYWNDTTWKLEWLGETGAIVGNPSSALRENGEQYVYYEGTNGRLYFWYWNDTTWKLEWLGETGVVAGDPSPVVRSNGEQYVYYGRLTGRLDFWYWNDTTWKLEWLGEPGAI